MSWLLEALNRAPVALIVGPGGIGKTATVLHALHSRRSRVTTALFVPVRPGEPTDQVRFTLARLLSSLSGTEADLSLASGDPEGLVEVAIDSAESCSAWVVLDDVHHADAEEMNELLTQLSAYARKSKWIVTSRSNPDIPALASQTLELAGLDDGSLAKLAAFLSPTTADSMRSRVVRSSAGSPWLLQQYITGGASSVAMSRDRLLEGLAPEVTRFLRALSLLRVVFPLHVIGKLAPIPSEEVLDGLVQRGLVQRDRVGIRLHDAVSGHLFPDPSRDGSTAELKRIAAESLVETGEAEAILEAARLFVELGDTAALSALLDGQAEALFAGGYAPKLWLIVAEMCEPCFLKWQLRCAAELGNPTALGAVDEPVESDPTEYLAWAQAQYAQGDVAAAMVLAAQVHRDASEVKDRKSAHEAELLRARCLLHGDRGEEAQRALDGLEGGGARELALRALLLASSGHSSASTVAKEALQVANDGSFYHEVAGDVALAMYIVGRRHRADEILDEVTASPRGGRAALFVARRAMLLRAQIRLDAGELDEVEELVAKVEPYARGGSLLRPYLLELDCARRIVAGEYEGLQSRVETALRESTGVDARCERQCRALGERLASEIGCGLTMDELEAGFAEERGAAVALRWSRFDSGAPLVATTSAVGPEWTLARAQAALVLGNHSKAADWADLARREAERTGDRCVVAEALRFQCEALMCAHREGELAIAASELSIVATEMASSRFAVEAAFFQCDGAPEMLEMIAQKGMVAPTAARRAQARLSSSFMPPRLADAIDRLVVDALFEGGRLQGWALDTVCPPPLQEWCPGWGLDERRSCLWLPNGAVVDLSGRALLWRFVKVLADDGGAASKEELFLGAWQEKSYHPLRHDSRIHVAVRKLRMELEDDPSRPTRLLTTDEGYRLGGTVRRVRVMGIDVQRSS